ncbi:unnamed protein product [Cochlearia groenlandica]
MVKGTILPCYTKSQDQLADIFTKSASLKVSFIPSGFLTKVFNEARQNRSHKCKRDQGIVRTSLVHQDDDLSCDEGRRQAAEVTSSLSYRCKGKRKKTVAKRAVGKSHMCALRARVSNLS